MASLNQVQLIGNLTRDPELRYTPKGAAVSKASIAINRTWKNEAGETKEECTFVDIDVWGRTAENLAQYCRKGKSILVLGRLKLDSWEKDGKTHQKLGVTAESIQFLGEKGGGDSAPRPPRESTSSPAESKPKEGEDDVPF